MSTVRITDLNADDRPREKAIRSGIKSLSDAELLAIIIGQGLPGMSALLPNTFIKITQKILNTAINIENVLPLTRARFGLLCILL